MFYILIQSYINEKNYKDAGIQKNIFYILINSFNLSICY